MNDIEWKKVGDWWDLPWWRKTLRWVRYQPLHKTIAFAIWTVYCIEWYTRIRRWPKAGSGWDDRIKPGQSAEEEGIWPTPGLMWEITVAQDADEIKRLWQWISPSKREEGTDDCIKG